jgi:hypothetical protein
MNPAQNTSSVRKIFLSCVTKEFGHHREMLTKDLSLPDVKVQVQEDFVEGGHSTLEKLDEYIKGCAAVIHLIGYATGSMPAPTEVAALLKKHSDFAQRIPCLKEALAKTPASLSYTQWEAWLAIYHSIPCFVYQAEPTTVRAPGFKEDANQRNVQKKHWKRFRVHGKDRKIFHDEQQLCRLVLRSLSNILPSGNLKLNVIPKGLRSFDAKDADFFLDLLPAPRDKDGLPESIRFWQHRIEECDEATFTVGVIYGPSGCGKSSLMKAGLLPRLSEHVLTVYIEATGTDTEARLLKGLRKRCPDLPSDLDLTNSIANLKDGNRLKSGWKVLLVIDQFEQWLHAKRSEQNTELVQALRQCDGNHVQCVVLVRDDFWLTISRFMGELQINLQQGHNLALVDLFDPIHSRNILAAFGRGFGKLEQDPTQEQGVFLDQAVAGLSQDGRVICVRLALFAEMVKGKPWTPATWEEVGGTEGVGFTFLDDTFFSRTANPKHRFHQKAAQAILKALLPESGTDIKGHMRSCDELLEASVYVSRLNDFDELIRILDNEIRLITPTDPEDKEGDSSSHDQAGVKYYQLTHDYLVPSLRDWLTRKQKETRRGRAELLLADRAAVWNARPENRQLPSLMLWFQIRWLTQKKNWTQPQQKMMAKAGRYHVVRGLAITLILALYGLGSWEGFGRLEGWRLRDRLLESTTADVPGIVKDMAGYRRWVDPLLQEAYAQAEQEKDPRKQLHSSLALLPVDSGQVDYLYQRLLKAEPQEVMVIRESLLDHKEDLTTKLWALVENPQNDQDERFRSACALAVFAPIDARWEKLSGEVAEMLVNQEPFTISQWTDVLKPVGNLLIPPMADFLPDEKRSLSAKALIAKVYSTYAADKRWRSG